jgi:small-conductance mechanosensitive channel
MTMVRLFFFIWVLFHVASSHASGSFAMPPSPAEPSASELPPKSQEIKKIAKLLENPQEREKLLKTLKILASAQEAQEKKESGSLGAYLMPVLQFGRDSASAFLNNLKKIPARLSGFMDYLKIKENRDHFLIALSLGFPLFLLIEFLFAWCLWKWRLKRMPQYLGQSHSLLTVPKKWAFPVNMGIRYLPIFLFLFSIPCLADGLFFDGNFLKGYGIEGLVTFMALVLFLGGRSRLDAFANYKIPRAQSSKIQAFLSYGALLRLPLAKGLQWIWHLAFLGTLMAVWNQFFSSLFVSIVSHPVIKTMAAIGLIWGMTYLAWLGLDAFVGFHTKPQTVKGKRREPTVFAKTFGPMLHSVGRWVLMLVAVFATLESLGFDLKILVYLMSAFALAISLGAQSLVKDVINGFFALVDGSFSVGDVVTVGAHTGTVESLSLKAITLRHKNGYLQKIPFSEVGNVINQSRDYTVVPIDIAISYKTKIGSVYEALTRAAEEIKEDPVFGKMILEPLSFSGIDRFSENAVHVSASIKITPDPGNYFARELNRRLKAHMDALGIAPPISFQEPWSEG